MKNILRGMLELFHINIKNDALLKYLDIFTRVILILILIKIVISISNKLIERFFLHQRKLKFGMSEKKANTLSELLKSLLRYALYFVAIISVFGTLWPNVSTTIAFTSVLGVAIGFGAQNLVKDVIAGVFILFEDQFAVGDYITIEGCSGNVEALGIRATRIRDFSGELHIIPNGNITVVTNKTRGDMRALVEINLPYDEDLDIAIKVINEVNEEIQRDLEVITSGPEVLGVAGFADNGVIIRVVAKTVPMKQWEVEYELRKRIKNVFDEKGIKLGYSKRIIVENRGGITDDYKL
jgi:moderate conductance mechanosensitive channel